MGCSQAGYSLIDVMIAAGILVIVSFAVAITSVQFAVRMAKMGGLSKIDVVKTNVASLAFDNASWLASVNGALNGAVKTCIQSFKSTSSTCIPPIWCSRFSANSACTCGSSSSASATCPTSLAASRNFSLYDASGVLFYNAQDSRNGFNSVGIQCGPDAPIVQNRADRFPSANCPYRYDLRWYTIPNGSTSPRVIGIRATLQVAPDTNSQLNPNRYSVPLMFRSAN